MRHEFAGARVPGEPQEETTRREALCAQERVEVHDLDISDFGRIPKIMDDFLEVIETVGPNPYKGM